MDLGAEKGQGGFRRRGMKRTAVHRGDRLGLSVWIEGVVSG
jgi:hypothetical protein